MSSIKKADILQEVGRKSLHLFALAIPCGVLWLGTRPALVILAVASLLSVSIELARARSERLNQMVLAFFGDIMREHECNVGDGRVVFTGATWVFLAGLVVFSLFSTQIAVGAFLIWAIGDTSAAFFGRRFGRTPVSNGRTAEGSMFFFASATLLLFVVTGSSAPVILCGSLAGAFSEIPDGPFNDNFRIPLVSGVAMFLTDLFLTQVDIGFL